MRLPLINKGYRPSLEGKERTVTHNELNWIYTNDVANETDVQQSARALSLEHGVDPIDPAIGAQIAVVVAATNAQQIAEIGTGFGVSGLWALRGAPKATLTSIDEEYERHEAAKPLFTKAGYAASQVRLITGKALEVLPRMNENSYDVVIVDGDPRQVVENTEHALRLVRVGGTVLVPHALWQGEVAEPAKRSAIPSGFRSIITEATESDAVISALSPAGDGLFQMTKLA